MIYKNQKLVKHTMNSEYLNNLLTLLENAMGRVETVLTEMNDDFTHWEEIILQEEEEVRRIVEEKMMSLEGIRDYTDLHFYFDENPSARLLVTMPSGKPAMVSKYTLDGLLQFHEGDYEDQEEYTMDNFKVVSLITQSKEADQIIKETRSKKTQPDMAGIDDVRFNIQEKYVPGDYYCPSNMNCVTKCIMKYLELVGEDHWREKVRHLSFQNAYTIPQINALLKDQEINIRVVSYTNKDNWYSEQFITVPICKYEVKPGYYHSVLILNVNKYRRNLFNHSIEYEYTSLEDCNDLDLLVKGEKLKKFHLCEKSVIKVYAFDFETYMLESNCLKVQYKQEPYLLEWGDEWKVDYCFDLDNPKNLVQKFLVFLKEKLIEEDRKRESGDCTTRKICMFSYNGAQFDNHLFLEYLDNPEWEIKHKFLGDESVIKRFSIQCNSLKFRNEVYFMDAMLFFAPGTSLEKACQTFECKNIKYDKKDFDITNYMTRESILENKDQIIQYGCQDVKATYELMRKYEKSMKEVSGTELSIFTCVSIANYADKIRDFYHDRSIKIFYNERKEIAEFERNCVLGGRLLVGRLKYDKPSLAADINSLYPSAMHMFEYPCDERTYYNRALHPEKMEEYKNKLNNGEDVPLSNLRVRVELDSKCLVPMLPVRGSPPDELIKTGDFTVVELQEAIQHGGVRILEVLFIQEFKGKAKLFEKFVNTFYNKRLEYKKKMKECPEEKAKYDVLQELCKLILNSSYGTLVMKPFDSVFQFISKTRFERDFDDTVQLITIANGQYFTKYKNKCHHDNNKPIYLGAFILSYSKKILNRYIKSLDGFYHPTILYGDTDSVYIPLESFKKLEEEQLVGNELGQCKNDYENQVIEKFRCLGKKMKVCMLSDGEIKTTLKGMKGLKKMNQDEKKKLFTQFDQVLDYDLKQPFKQISFETMRRNALQVNVTASTRSFKMTVYDQYKVEDGNCFPLYYQ